MSILFLVTYILVFTLILASLVANILRIQDSIATSAFSTISTAALDLLPGIAFVHWIYDYKIGRDKDYQVRLSSLNLRTYTESYEETQQYVVDDTPATYRQSLGSRKGNKDEERQMLLWLAQQRASKLLLQQKLESSKSANTDGFDSEGVKTEGSGCPWNPEQEPLEAIALHFEMQMKRRYSRRRQMNKEIDPKVDVIPTTAIRVLADSAEPMAHDFAWRFHFKNAKSCLILNPMWSAYSTEEIPVTFFFTSEAKQFAVLAGLLREFNLIEDITTEQLNIS